MWDVITSLPYSSFMKAVVWGAFIGLAAGTLLVVLLVKLGFWKRENRAYNLAVKLFYLYIPVILSVTGMTWQLNALAKGEVLGLLETFRPKINALAAEKAEAALETFGFQDAGHAASPSMLMLSLKESLDSAADPILEPLPAPVRAAVKPVWGTVTRFVAENIEKELLTLLGAKFGLNDAETGQFMVKSIILTLKGGILVDVVRVQVEKRFDGVNGIICQTAILLLLPVVLEAALYHFLRRKKRPSPNP